MTKANWAPMLKRLSCRRDVLCSSVVSREGPASDQSVDEGYVVRRSFEGQLASISTLDSTSGKEASDKTPSGYCGIREKKGSRRGSRKVSNEAKMEIRPCNGLFDRLFVLLQTQWRRSCKVCDGFFGGGEGEG